MEKNEFKKIRESLSYNKTKIAREFGVSYQTVWNWENGKTKIPKMAQLLLKKKQSYTPEQVKQAVDGAMQEYYKHGYTRTAKSVRDAILKQFD